MIGWGPWREKGWRRSVCRRQRETEKETDYDKGGRATGQRHKEAELS